MLLAVFMALPLVYTVSTAFKPIEELFLFPPRFFVRHPTLRNFQQLLISTWAWVVPFPRYIFNSFFVTSMTVLGHVLIASMAAYSLAKLGVPGGNVIFGIIIAALMFAPEVTQIPRYLVVHRLGLLDTFAGLIIPNLAGAYGLFLMKQFMEQVPVELLEAAKVDGAREWTIFRYVVLPMVRPALITLVIFSFISSWNDIFTPLVFTRSESMKTLPLAISNISGGATVVANFGAVSAGALVTTLPPIIIFVLLQRWVMETMAYSGIKS
jgi:ABC-type glycerol-3-phosphate transport system permease component